MRGFLNLIFACVILSPHLGVARGANSSGGGSGVVCFQSEATAKDVEKRGGLIAASELLLINSIETLDLWEAKRRSASQQNSISRVIQVRPHVTSERIVTAVVQRLRDTVASSPKAIQVDLNAKKPARLTNPLLDVLNRRRVIFPPQRVIFNPTSLKRIEDHESESVFLGANCVLVQLAVQRTQNGLNHLFIDERLYNHPRHTELSRAALWLHEYIYFLTKQQGDPDSQRARRAVGLLLSNDPSLKLDFFLNQLCLDELLGESRQNCSEEFAPQLFKHADIAADLEFASVVSLPKKIWYDNKFRSSASGRSSKEILAELASVLKQIDLQVEHDVLLHSNLALSYLEKHFADTENKDLLRLKEELKALIDERSELIRVEYLKGVVKWLNESPRSVLVHQIQIQAAETMSYLVKGLAQKGCLREDVEKWYEMQLSKRDRSSFSSAICFEQIIENSFPFADEYFSSFPRQNANYWHGIVTSQLLARSLSFYNPLMRQLPIPQFAEAIQSENKTRQHKYSVSKLKFGMKCRSKNSRDTNVRVSASIFGDLTEAGTTIRIVRLTVRTKEGYEKNVDDEEFSFRIHQSCPFCLSIRPKIISKTGAEREVELKLQGLKQMKKQELSYIRQTVNGPVYAGPATLEIKGRDPIKLHCSFN